jgi:hypothetical protein
MASDDPSLVVNLEARISEFEKQMAKAAKVAAKRLAEIEARNQTMVQRLNASFGGLGGTTLTFFKGLGAGAIASLGPIELLQQALAAIDNASHLVDTADRVGLSTAALQELTFGFSQASVEASEFESAMDKFSKKIGEAAVSGNYLGKILQANGIAIRDHNGHLKNSEQLLGDYADLVKNAGSEQEKMLLVTEAFGKGGAAMLVGLNDGAQGILNMQKAASDAGGVIDDQLLQRAEQMGDRWDAAWHRFAVSSQSAILTALEGMDDLSNRMTKFMVQQQAADLGNLAGSLVGKPGDVLTGPGKGNRSVDPIDSRIASAFGGEITKADDALVAQLKKRYGDATHKATVLPSSATATKSGSKLTPKTADDRFAEDLQAIRDRTAALAQEASMVGLSFEAQTQRRTSLELEQTALKQVREEARKKGDQDWQNAQLTPDMIAKIDAQSAAFARQSEVLKEMQDAQALQRDVLQGVFDDLRGALDDGKLDWADFAKVAEGALDKIINKIETDLIDAIMTGGGGGSDPGIIAALGLRANGGPVTAGQPYIVGEKRPELFIPHSSGMIVPRVPSMPAISGRGGGDQNVSISFSPQISVQGGDGNDAGQQVTAALKAYQKEFVPNVLKALREAKQRGMV